MTSKRLADPLLTRVESTNYIKKSYSFLSKEMKNQKHNFKTKRKGKHVMYYKSSLDAFIDEPMKP